MIPKDKYDAVNRWAAVKVMGWDWRDNQTFYCNTIGDLDFVRKKEDWNPCTDLNDCKMVVDRLRSIKQKVSYIAELLGIPADCYDVKSEQESTMGLALSECFTIANAPADLRMEAVIKVFFPDKTTYEAIDIIEKELC